MEKFEKDNLNNFKGQWIMLRDEDGVGKLTVSGESSVAFKVSALAAALVETLRNETELGFAAAMALVTSSVAAAYRKDSEDA